MKITLVRHAEVIEEYQGKYNGHIDISLSEKGKLDSVKLAKSLKDEKFDKIYCSDLLRARQTLESFDYKIKPVFTNKLREKSWGRHEGKSFDEINSEGIEYINFEQWISSLDGEDIHSYTEKVKNYFFETIFKQKHDNILVVTHAGVIKTLMAIINKTPLEEAFSISFPYATYTVLDRVNMKFIKP